MPEFKTSEKERTAARAWSAANPERKRATRRAYYAANKAVIIAKARAWEIANPGKKYARNRAKRLLEVYAISAAEFLDMKDKQQSRCNICLQQFKSSRHIHIDHNHTTGVTRSLLCAGCNTALGHLEKQGGLWLSRALMYLAKHAAGNPEWVEASE